VVSGRVGVCPRCSIEGDKNQKPLYYCPFCGGYFCEKHVKPRLVMSFEAYQSYVTTYKDIAEVLREHWQSTDGHPCPEFTRHFWQEYEQRKREELLPPLPAKVSRPREEVTLRRREMEAETEQAPTRVRVTVRRRSRGGEAAGPTSRVLAALGLLILMAAFTMPWLQATVPFVQKVTLADTYASIYSSSSPILIDLRFFPVSSVAFLSTIILYPLAVILALIQLLRGSRSTLPGWLASAAALLWYVGVEAFKAEIVKAYSSGNPLVEPLLRTLVFQTIGIDYGVTVASIGGILLVVAGWLRG
jgi:hypothetical protein